jgi:hypothetical protein
VKLKEGMSFLSKPPLPGTYAAAMAAASTEQGGIANEESSEQTDR